MKTQLRKAVARYMRAELLKTRNQLELSQEAMGAKLGISTRAYRNLESGRSCCSMMTLLMYCLECCPNRRDFMKGLEETVNSVKLDEFSR